MIKQVMLWKARCLTCCCCFVPRGWLPLELEFTPQPLASPLALRLLFRLLPSLLTTLLLVSEPGSGAGRPARLAAASFIFCTMADLYSGSSHLARMASAMACLCSAELDSLLRVGRRQGEGKRSSVGWHQLNTAAGPCCTNW